MIDRLRNDLPVNAKGQKEKGGPSASREQSIAADTIVFG